MLINYFIISDAPGASYLKQKTNTPNTEFVFGVHFCTVPPERFTHFDMKFYTKVVFCKVT